MSNLCTNKDCYSFGRYCRLHSGKQDKPAVAPKEKPPKKKPPKQKPIKPFSKKREKLQREYRKQVQEALEENKECEVKSPDCIQESNGMQHIQKRTVKNLLDKTNQLRCCAGCQTWIEENPKEAIEMKVSASKYKPAS